MICTILGNWGSRSNIYDLKSAVRDHLGRMVHCESEFHFLDQCLRVSDAAMDVCGASDFDPACQYLEFRGFELFDELLDVCCNSRVIVFHFRSIISPYNDLLGQIVWYVSM